MSESAARPRVSVEETRERRVVVAALGVSLVLHGLLAVAAVLLSVLVVPAPPPPRSEIRFTFAPLDPQSEEQPLFHGPEPSIPGTTAPEVPPTLEPLEPTERARVEPAPAAGALEAAPPEAATSLDAAPSAAAAPRGLEPRTGRALPERAPSLDQRLDAFGEALSRARRAQDGTAETGRSRNVFTPDPVALPGTGFGVGNLTFASTDYDWSDYARQIYIAIWRAWHNRLYRTTDAFEKWSHETMRWRLDHASGVTFVIERSGEVTQIVLESPAGCPPLDASAMEALDEVILPPLPEDFPRDSEAVRARFIAIGEVRSLRPTLARLKELGYF